jgi:hypothetical protein
VIAVHKICSRHYGFTSHTISPSYIVPSFSFIVFDGVYGKIGTEDLAKRAVHALRRIDDFGVMIPFFIVFVGHAQDPAGTEGDAEFAALTAVFNDDDLPQVCPVLFQI